MIQTLRHLVSNKSFVFASLVCIAIAVQFWTGSRLPALDQKAMMAGTAGMEPLAFDTVLVASRDDPIHKQIAYGFVNWAKTNQRGMTFGFMFAAALLTLISLLKRKSLEGSFSNSALGVLIGTPLGVCVNCAAPIARGLHASGMRLETTLAAMISSPTLNVVVLAMLMSLFPFYMVALKVGATLLFLFCLLPLLSRFVFRNEAVLTDRRIASKMVPDDVRFTPLAAEGPTEEQINEWWPAARWMAVNYARNLWFIIKTTLPLMILAGILGSAVVILMPLDSLAELIPGGGKFQTLAAMGLTAIIGVFLPVPIAFDVVVVAVLLAAGMPVRFAMVLLFTLGIYSIYSYFIVQQTLSRKIALTVYLVIAALGVAIGVVAHVYSEWDTERKHDFLFTTWAQTGRLEIDVAVADPGLPADEVLPQLQAQRLAPSPTGPRAKTGVSVSALPLSVGQVNGEKLFTRRTGGEVGIEQPYQISILKWSEPFADMHGMAAGDVHNDGWEDIVTAPELGIFLYSNIGGTYIPQRIEVDNLHDLYVLNVALVDLNDDGWLDLYYSTYRQGNFLIYNQQGRFTGANQVRLPNQPDAWATQATAFADLDLDGDLDIVLGNWTLGEHLIRPIRGRSSSRNILLRNNGRKFTMEDIPGEPGETLTTLVTDLNGDTFPDLIIGNDFDVPDMYYLGDADGKLNLVLRDDDFVEISARFTMSAIPGDLDNDLVDEIFIGNISGTDNSPMRKFADICIETSGTPRHDECVMVRSDQKILNNSITRRDPFLCEQLEDKDLAKQCVGQHVFGTAWRDSRAELCPLLRGRLDAIADICDEYFSMTDLPAGSAFDQYIAQARERSNVLLQYDGKKWNDKAIDWNLDEAGWVWTAQFADLNHDEYLDLYAGTGMFIELNSVARESNMFFVNESGMSFSEQTEEAGLDLFAETSSFVYTDSDNDGDLDIVLLEAIGPVWFFENNQTDGRSIILELDDELGNRDGIGSRITIFYGPDDSQRQVRQINASGPFHSFGGFAAHFGLGETESVNRVEVQWQTGDTSTVHGPLESGHRYIISRR